MASAWRDFHDEVTQAWYLHIDHAGPALKHGPPREDTTSPPLFTPSEVRPHLPAQPGDGNPPGLPGDGFNVAPPAGPGTPADAPPITGAPDQAGGVIP